MENSRLTQPSIYGTYMNVKGLTMAYPIIITHTSESYGNMYTAHLSKQPTPAEYIFNRRGASGYTNSYLGHSAAVLYMELRPRVYCGQQVAP